MTSDTINDSIFYHESIISIFITNVNYTGRGGEHDPRDDQGVGAPGLEGKQ